MPSAGWQGDWIIKKAVLNEYLSRDLLNVRL